ncbi:MAG TPA: hypothetical protein VG015_03555 [Candidatus Dormibacteraeota bacterium]|nr:hypothetical protein [Candidatus Dormibacteraeota bacterium]
MAPAPTAQRSKSLTIPWPVRFLLHLFGLAAAVILAGGTAYVLGWELLQNGLRGSDSSFQLSLAQWVSSSFPRLSWWYPWDANGIPYREGYPLIAHWVTVAVSRNSGLSIGQTMQVLGWGMAPAVAVGVYAFCAWRLQRPVAGLAAAVLSLLSPIAWTFIADWGFFANQAGVVFFMPTLIAVDITCSRWTAGDRGWRLRAAAVATIALTCLEGWVSPSTVGGPFLALAVYALAAGRGAKRSLRWFLLVAPAICLGALFLAAFWALPLQDWLAVVGGRHPAPTFSPDLLPLQPLSQLLDLNGISQADIHDRISVAPAVWIPALVGVLAAIWDRRVRVVAVLAALGAVMITSPQLYWFLASNPVTSPLNIVINVRLGWVLMQCLVPLLAGVGLLSVAPELARAALGRLGAPGALGLVVAGLLAVVGLSAGVMGVEGGVLRIHQLPHLVAYGATPVDIRDIWKRHRDDPCIVTDRAQACSSTALNSAFSLGDLSLACVGLHGLRTGIPLCQALGLAQNWDPSDENLVTATQTWCQSNQADLVCQAQYTPLLDQLSPNGWRPLQVGCDLEPECKARALAAAKVPKPFASGPPQRAVLDANNSDLLKNFHQLTGGGQAYGYNFQLIGSPELDSFALDTMIAKGDQVSVAQAAQRLGADSVVLASNQQNMVKDYQALGWRPEGQGSYLAPSPTGLAAQWNQGSAALVIGASQSSAAEPYNGILEQAIGGMIPASRAWFARGSSIYVDDYSDQQLANFPVLILDGYRVHDSSGAWQKLDRYVRNGGRLFVETGWQWVDPDWNAGLAPATLPVTRLDWGPVNPSAPVLVNGQPAPGWGSMTYGGSGWGASSSAGLRPGATALVTEGGKILVANWTLGKGQVLWSGMNVIPHAQGAHSAVEDQFLTSAFAALLPRAGEAQPVTPTWTGDNSATIALEPTTSPSWVIFRESNAPGWAAQLSTPSGTQAVPIQDGELDFMMIRLDSITSGSKLVFTYGPTGRDMVWWGISVLAALALLGWLFFPAPYRRLQLMARGALARVRERGVRRVHKMSAEEEDDY